MPGESQEQECLFVEIEKTRDQIKDGKTRSMISGNASIFGINDKLPFGFFAKAIKQADQAITKDFFFYDIETNNKIYRDKVQRSFSFVYFFSGQYDPDTGSIDEVTLSTTIEG